MSIEFQTYFGALSSPRLSNLWLMPSIASQNIAASMF